MADVICDNPNAFRTLADHLQALEGVVGKAGWFADAAYADGTPVAQVAYWQEVGVPSQSIPSRSFMRSTALEKDAEWREVANTVSQRVLEGKMTPAEAMDVLAGKAAGDIRKKISTITSPPLSKITLGARKYRQMGRKVTGATIGEIARKIQEGTLDLSGVSDKPLVDQGIMVTTLTHTVESEGA